VLFRHAARVRSRDCQCASESRELGFSEELKKGSERRSEARYVRGDTRSRSRTRERACFYRRDNSIDKVQSACLRGCQNTRIRRLANFHSRFKSRSSREFAPLGDANDGPPRSLSLSLSLSRLSPKTRQLIYARAIRPSPVIEGEIASIIGAERSLARIAPRDSRPRAAFGRRGNVVADSSFPPPSPPPFPARPTGAWKLASSQRSRGGRYARRSSSLRPVQRRPSRRGNQLLRGRERRPVVCY